MWDLIKLVVAVLYLFVLMPWFLYVTVKVAQHVEAWPFA